MKPHLSRLGLGALAGAMLTAPLIGLMYLADKLLDLPFVPFAFFDWLARILPGPLVTFGIDLMIDGLRLAGFSVAAAAKTGEQLGAILLFWVIGIALAALVFAVHQKREARPPLTGRDTPFSKPILGLIIGLFFGIPMTLVSLPMGQSTMNPIVTAIVLMALFLLWGLTLSWTCRRTAGPAAAATAAAGADAAASILNRRQFLVRLGATTATITVAGAGLGMVLNQEERARFDQAVDTTMPPMPRRPLPNDGDPVMPAPGTRPEYTPVEDHYQVFLRTEPTFIDIGNWILPITGLVANPMEMTIEQLRAYPARDQYVTLSCISGRIATTLISTTWWTGVSLQTLLADWQPLPNARYLLIKSADGFFETVDLALINSDERIMLCYAWDGEPLPFDHGFPLRIWLPDRYGMKQPKWIISIEVTDEYREGYWVERGWDEVAQVQTTSVIDTVAVRNVVDRDGQRLVPVGGIAFAGARGISRVQVRVDGGPWQDAQLRTPLSETTWVIWRYDWPFAAGDHNFEVRCAELDGTPQIEEQRGNRPSGATGIHRREATL